MPLLCSLPVGMRWRAAKWARPRCSGLVFGMQCRACGHGRRREAFAGSACGGGSSGWQRLLDN